MKQVFRQMNQAQKSQEILLGYYVSSLGLGTLTETVHFIFTATLELNTTIICNLMMRKLDLVSHD